MFSGHSYNVSIYFEILHCLKAGESVQTGTLSMQKARFPSDLVYEALWSSLFLSCVMLFAHLVCTLLCHSSTFLGKWHYPVKPHLSAGQSRSAIKHSTELLISLPSKAPCLLWHICFFPLVLSHFLEGLKFKVSTFLKMTLRLMFRKYFSFCPWSCWMTPVDGELKQRLVTCLW